MSTVRWPIVALLLGLAGCGNTGGDSDFVPQTTSADTPLLFMGNSHSAYNNLQGMVVDMVGSAQPGKSVAAIAAPGWMFLDERFHHGPSLLQLRAQDWSFVVLQAQKYSSSGAYQYSTAEAVQFIQMAHQQHAVPILFPEWPRLGVDETMRIYDLHVSIAREEPACVAPIGQAWDLSRSRHPNLVLHAEDGNHSNAAGAFLTALVLYATITGVSPLQVPALSGYSVDADTQALLRAVADDTVQAWPPRQWCPDDPY